MLQENEDGQSGRHDAEREHEVLTEPNPLSSQRALLASGGDSDASLECVRKERDQISVFPAKKRNGRLPAWEAARRRARVRNA